ncbi:assimilatory nitrate reductase (NADH) alpha subunit apoprotein [Fluviicoccus keumensis]|uniref:Assimilatory nitrate reductase (NADH) alpha subunit apoprotein n=2 Tax=Fluviicoccus keumensis TaxID=1435465 RepID=A0A4Q7ZDU0_9GAMM|nr:nitrate reductase [Fluviicoccus keumensis]RZU48215.1 assimilatory nitrate reductase (NADH) alpha subunit apoprotein [Fluviicoccus keumensis]
MLADAVVKTTCAYCGVGCGIAATVTDAAARVVDIKGDITHPANFGRLCSKGSSLGETVSLEGRQLVPEINGQPVAWATATTKIASEFKRIRDQHGPDAIAFYVSGQLLTEDYYVANKLMKGFIGSANIDTNSRLCMSSAVAGYKRAFGADSVPASYEDFAHAELMVLVGSNTAWCHPIIFQRIKAIKAEKPNLKVVVIDPRETATHEIADLHLPIKSGGDVLLFNALLAELAERGAVDTLFTAAHCTGLEAAVASAKADRGDRATLAARLGIPADRLHTFFDWFTATERTLTMYSMGVNQSSAGTDKANAIINCHLATGRIGKPGAAPFSLTGQPNAMGGREAGGLANMLAAHMDLENPAHRERVQRFWGAPSIPQQPGLKAVDLFDAVHEGKVKAVWIMATNPVVSLPNADRVRAALEKCELVIVSDCIADTDTMRLAHIKLPALGWGEKDGTVTNSERRISRQRGLLPPPGEARPDWWALAAVAKAMGYAEAFAYDHPAQIFREHAALSAFENNAESGIRDFNIGLLAQLDNREYNALKPVQWPVTPDAPLGTERLFTDNRFYTPDGKARLVPLAYRAPVNALSADYPLVLNTGRIRDQWHTMTRSGLTPRLLQHIGEPFAEMHPDEAKNRGLTEGGLVRLSSRWGKAVARVQFSTGQQPGHVFMPMHWTGVLSRSGRVGAVVNPAVDPVSGQPENKHTPVAAERYPAAWHGYLLSRAPLALPAVDYAVAIRLDNGWRYELANDHVPDDWTGWATAWLQQPEGEVLEYQDVTRGIHRYAWIADSVLAALAFFGPEAELPPRAWLQSLLGKPVDALSRRALLSGKPADPEADVGRIICACFGVGEKTITRAIGQQNLKNVAEIGKCLKAGTNCGSCQPELKKLIPCEAIPA